jgi:hypothetical protein
MDYKEKYFKYKLKYIQLKNMYGGNPPSDTSMSCVSTDIFDLDCIIPITKNENEDYIFKKRLSRETINYIRSEIQNYYEYFYNYLMFPDLSIDKLKTYNIRDEIIIPIINKEENVNNNELSVGIVDYNIIKQKLMNNNFIEKAQKLNEINTNLNNSLISYKNYLHTIKENKIFNITDNDINNIDSYKDSYKDITILPNDNIADNIYLLYTNKYDEYTVNYNQYNNLVNLFNRSTAQEQTKIDKEMKEIRQNYTNASKKSNEYSEIYKNIMTTRKAVDEQRKLLIQFRKNIGYNNINLLYDLINYDDTNDIMSMIEEKKKNICKNIIDKFNKNQNLNCQILSVNLDFFDSDIKQINQEEIGHANSVTIYRFKKDGKDAYLCLRTEPHRHTNIYCRNSVRKAIRDIFKYLNNSYYLDYIIESKEGLQINEDQDIQKENLTDFDNIPQNIQLLSPLQGNSGFCASWTIYTLLVLMTNRNISLEKIGKYFADFNLKNTEKESISKFKTELDRCYINQNIDSSCKSKQIFETEFKKYINYNPATRQYIIPNKTQQKNYTYILMKQIKLYRMIIFIFYFITKKLEISELFDKIENDFDKKILNELFNKFDNFNIFNILHDRLNIQNKLKIDISSSILDRDMHLCDDNLFEHKDFCNINDLIKPIPNPDNYKCNSNKLKENGNIRLKGLENTINEEKIQSDKINMDINYIFQKL